MVIGKAGRGGVGADMDEPEAGGVIQVVPADIGVGGGGGEALPANHLKAVQLVLPDQGSGFHDVVALNGAQFADIRSGGVFLSHMQPSVGEF